MTIKVGDKGQFGYDARSHDDAGCCSYEVLRKLPDGLTEVLLTAPCDKGRIMEVRFVSSAEYDRHF